VVATFAGGPLSGIPAVLRNSYGAGTAWYVATLPEPAALARILSAACDRAGAEPVLAGLAPRIEAIRRGDKIFLLNHDDESVEIRDLDHNAS
jgi:beta-galactosidase